MCMTLAPKESDRKEKVLTVIADRNHQEHGKEQILLARIYNVVSSRPCAYRYPASSKERSTYNL